MGNDWKMKLTEEIILKEEATIFARNAQIVADDTDQRAAHLVQLRMYQRYLNDAMIDYVNTMITPRWIIPSQERTDMHPSDYYSLSYMSYPPPAPPAPNMEVVDNRVKATRVVRNTSSIPNNTVFQGLIGSIRGTFKKNQETIFQLDGTAIFTSGSINPNIASCFDYQPVRGRVVIERNA